MHVICLKAKHFNDKNSQLPYEDRGIIILGENCDRAPMKSITRRDPSNN